MKLFIIILGILFFQIPAACQELKFTNLKNGKITSFVTGDKVGITLKGWTIPDKVAGVLTGFDESHIVINDKQYLFTQIHNIRHSKPLTDFLFGFLSLVALLTAGILFIPAILPHGGNFTPFIIFLVIGYGSLVTKEILTGYRVNLRKHSMEILDTPQNSDTKQNP